MSHSNYLKTALEAVSAGERVINKYYSKEIRSSLKPDQSPVTIADQEAETKLWDIAAVSLIVEEAGGKVTDFTGNRVNQNTTSIIATNGLLHDQVLGYFGA